MAAAAEAEQVSARLRGEREASDVKFEDLE
jgi:hypothetical protein